MSAPKDFYSITREDAAAKLGISTRTIDRYVKRKKLRTKLSPSRTILIHEKDLAKFKTQATSKTNKKTPNSSQFKKSPKPEMPQAEAIEVSSEAAEEKIFRELYDEASRDLKAKQEKLEAASFRVGQLEAQLKSSVPLLEFKQKEQSMLTEHSHLKEKLVAAILKGWVFLGLAITAAAISIVLAAINYF
jgi:hypothetical protein